MKSKTYFIVACVAALLSLLLFIWHNAISSRAIICIIAGVFNLAGVLTLIAGVRTRGRSLARALTIISSVAAVVGATLLLIFSDEVSAWMPELMSMAVAVAAMWHTVVILRRPISTMDHIQWLLIAPAILVGEAVYLWLLPNESDPQVMTAMGVAAAVVAMVSAIEGFLLRHAGQREKNGSLTPLEG